MDVLDGAGDGVRIHIISLGSYTTSGTSSRLHLSSKSLPGVLEDMDVLGGGETGVRIPITTLGSFAESFIMIYDYSKLCCTQKKEVGRTVTLYMGQKTFDVTSIF